jgi:hypothetical protein
MYSLSVEEEEVVDDDAAENMKEDEEGRRWGCERKALGSVDDATDDNIVRRKSVRRKSVRRKSSRELLQTTIPKYISSVKCEWFA